MNYRPEIDGLRALAVIPVILFHAGFSSFSGGYVGVDIFFVISGYLITSIIINDLDRSKFSILNFYERRARRILPALFFVMLICIPFAWELMPPLHLKDFGQSLVAVSLFSSNFLFWTESGYFVDFAEFKPLLHTWSLAVEEQFYIFFPIFLLIFWKFHRLILISAIAILFIVSLYLAQVGSTNSNSSISSATFLFLHSRAWELMIGAGAALYLKYFSKPCKRIFSNVFSSIGIILIFYSIYVFDASTPFPGTYALIPTLGTLLIILFANQTTAVYSLLTMRPIIGVGLISYSAYLWHQPILAFARYQTDFHNLNNVAIIFLCIFAVFFGYLSWNYVEKPFRDKKKFTRNQIFSMSLIGMIFFITIGIAMHLTDGLKEQKIKYEFTNTEKENFEIIDKSTNYDLYDTMQSEGCKIWIPAISELDAENFKNCVELHGSPTFIVGDSHALNIHNILFYSDKIKFLVGVSQGGCRAHDNLDSCGYDEFLKFLDTNSNISPKVIYHQSGLYFLRGSDNTLKPHLSDENIYYDRDNLDKLVKYFKKIQSLDINISWLGPFTEYGIDPIIKLSEIKNIPERHFKIFSELNKNIAESLKNTKIQYLEFDDFYKVDSQTVYEKCLIWRDPDHFSTCGEKIISTQLDLSKLY